ncbi:MAG: hypothetical protein ACJA08_002367 [Cyclobacteriaceae bacterium]|jgi:hypothetical protein
MTSNTKAPIWFWIVAVIALVWNAMGVMAYIMQVTMSPEDMAALPEAERALYADLPGWYTGAFALAVFGGAVASLALLLRKISAYLLYIISFLGIVSQMFYNFFMSKAAEVYGPGGMVMPMMVLVFGIVFIFFSKSAKEKGWIT